MKLSTYHLHTTYCDGKNTAEEMVQKAIELGCPEIGFSGHAYMDFDGSWCMTVENTERYKKEITELKKKYKDKIKIYMGIEQDYFSCLDTSDYDYVLGSVHYVYKNGEYLPVDLSRDATNAFVDKHYGGDMYAYCEDYYKLVADIYNKTKCDIIGHVDLCTKFNEGGVQFSTSHPRYVKCASDAVKALLYTPAIFEVNTGAISRGYRTESYPENFLLKIIGDSGKKLVINSDTHSTSTIDFGLESEAKRLDELGYGYITSLKEIINKL
ncbi:MAG: histidinol-phosphatase HisJ family protein [Clostridia bacterium]|nr:histidinol-phosphatase HisJ family protein [Clostridia bacterium]